MSHMFRMETDTLAFFGYKKGIFGVIGNGYINQFIIIPQVNGDNTCLADIRVFCDGGFFDDSVSGRHQQIF